jgi:hypothetical protein
MFVGFVVAFLVFLPVFGFAWALVFAESDSGRKWRILIDLLFRMGYSREKISEILDIYC